MAGFYGLDLSNIRNIDIIDVDVSYRGPTGFPFASSAALSGAPALPGVTGPATQGVDAFGFWGNVGMCTLVAVCYRFVAYLVLRSTSSSKTLG